jgi:PhnB protein
MLRLMASALLAVDEQGLSISQHTVRLMDSQATEPKESVMSKKIKPVPDGMHSVTPHLVCAGAAEAIEFYQKAFGAVDEGRLPGPDGRIMHAQIRINGSAVMLVDEMPEWGSLGPKALKGSPVTIHLYVDDVDAVVDRAVKAGAKVTMPVADQFWGDRYGQLEDPFGHRWSLATHVRDVPPEEWPEAMKKAAATMPRKTP